MRRRWRRLTSLSPLGAVLDNPIGQGPLEANIVAGFLGFDPLVLEDLFTLGLELSIKTGITEQVLPVRNGIRIDCHTGGYRRL